jgi:hypothetical protein
MSDVDINISDCLLTDDSAIFGLAWNFLEDDSQQKGKMRET